MLNAKLRTLLSGRATFTILLQDQNQKTYQYLYSSYLLPWLPPTHSEALSWLSDYYIFDRLIICRQILERINRTDSSKGNQQKNTRICPPTDDLLNMIWLQGSVSVLTVLMAINKWMLRNRLFVFIHLFRASLISFMTGRKNAITLRFHWRKRRGGRAAFQSKGQHGVEGQGMYCTACPKILSSCLSSPFILVTIDIY